MPQVPQPRRRVGTVRLAGDFGHAEIESSVDVGRGGREPPAAIRALPGGRVRPDGEWGDMRKVSLVSVGAFLAAGLVITTAGTAAAHGKSDAPVVKSVSP